MDFIILQPSILLASWLLKEAPLVDLDTLSEQKMLHDLVAEHSKQDREHMGVSDVIPVDALSLFCVKVTLM